jgi:hypothetical protein
MFGIEDKRSNDKKTHNFNRYLISNSIIDNPISREDINNDYIQPINDENANELILKNQIKFLNISET